MASSFLRSLHSLDLEEKILNLSLAGGMAGVFLPWFSGEWRGDEVRVFSGLGFYTSMLGIAVFLLLLFCLLLTLVPLFGGPQILKRRMREPVRTILAALACVLTLAALSVLTKMAFDFSLMELRFGIYVTLVGSIIAAMESVLRLREQRRQETLEESFRHPDAVAPRREKADAPFDPPPPPPPPPPPLEPEAHNVRL